MSQYHILMSDGQQRNIAGTSAGEAIQKALERNRLLTVTACWLGGFEGRKFGETGRVNFEVPPHKALPPKPKKLPEGTIPDDDASE